MIEIRNLTKNYGPHTAIQSLNFTIKKGEVVGFLGPNGAGKTTTMKIITGFMAPTSGEVKIAGVDVFENPVEVKKRIGYLPETPPVYGDMTVRDYLTFVAKLKGVEIANVKSHVDDALAKVHLGDVAHRMIQNLSKGYRQRVGIAQALVSKPDILILDEPTVGLDPTQVAEIRDLLLALRGHHTIILSTHILPEVEATCERVIIISKGKIVAENSISGLAQQLRGSVRRVQIRLRREPTAVLSSIKGLDGVQNADVQGDRLHVTFGGGDDVLERICETCVTSKAGLLEVVEPTRGLEQAFIELTTTGKEV